MIYFIDVVAVVVALLACDDVGAALVVHKQQPLSERNFALCWVPMCGHSPLDFK